MSDLTDKARDAALQGGAPLSAFVVELARALDAVKEDIDAMRPAPPEPDTPNTGRIRKFGPLIEPGRPKKRDRLAVAGIAAGGFAAAVLLDVAVRLFA